MSGVVNGDGPMMDPFPGITWHGQLADGSVPSRTPPPGADLPGGDSGIPGVGTPMSVDYQAGPGEGTATEQPGQNDLGLMGADQEPGYTGSGASEGHTGAWHRYSWQQRPGG